MTVDQRAPSTLDHLLAEDIDRVLDATVDQRALSAPDGADLGGGKVEQACDSRRRARMPAVPQLAASIAVSWRASRCAVRACRSSGWRRRPERFRRGDLGDPVGLESLRWLRQ
ncbi:MAG TPA: hypothetical protein PKC43_00990 [Phycisphaerales bacterium]|nr:hypothetical protein [Phycisphaerales bacterium]HMP36001.1 hypothetical protein [Phycisphaerales bacterium]